MEVIKGARNWRSILGTRTSPPPPPAPVAVATKPWPAPDTTVLCRAHPLHHRHDRIVHTQHTAAAFGSR